MAETPKLDEVQIADTEMKETKVTNAFTIPRKLVADYSSGSDSSSDDSECDSPSLEEGSESSSDGSDDGIVCEEVKIPIEDLTISVPSEQCQEIGKIKFIVEEQVIIEPKPGICALDLGTVLFLRGGECSLGRIDDVIGKVDEPIYSVTLPSIESITQKSIAPGMLVYYAPTTDHTSYVFLPDLLKMKGSDASWKNNQEAPLEEQEFSDDEQEKSARPKNTQNGHKKTRPNRKPRPRKTPPVPNWMPPIRPPLHNAPPQYPAEQPPNFNPYMPPPPPPPAPQYCYNYQMPYFNPNMGAPHNSQFPPPMTPPPMYQGQYPTPPMPGPNPPGLQDMRHWQKRDQ